MKSLKPISHPISLSLAGIIVLGLAACSDSPDDGVVYYSYGEPYYYTADYYDMGTVYDPYYYYYKIAASARDTLPGETVQEPLTYHAECTCYVRRATFNGVAGYERVRTDSVTFLDSSGAPLTVADTGGKAATINHKRHVVNSAGAREADILFDLTAEIIRDTGDTADTAGIRSIWNGTITGIFNGRPIEEATVDTVVRIFEDSTWGFPISGSISASTSLRDLKIVFNSDSTATATITDTESDRVFDVTVDETFKESEPVLK